MSRVSTYTTKQGDMWDLIAYTQLGGVEHTGRLIDLNRRHLGFYIFPAGIELILPETGPEVPGGLPPWKRVSSL